MIRSGAIIALLPYIAVALFVLAATIAAIIRAYRREPYTPPDVEPYDSWPICPDCSVRFPTRGQLHEHLHAAHGDS